VGKLIILMVWFVFIVVVLVVYSVMLVVRNSSVYLWCGFCRVVMIRWFSCRVKNVSNVIMIV